MTKENTCDHDLLAILHCKKCGEQFHTKWLEALINVKLEAIANVLERTKETIKFNAKGKNRDEATKIALAALEEVAEVYENSPADNGVINLSNGKQIKVSLEGTRKN